MATLQVKNMPDGLHDRIKARAKANNQTMSDYVTAALEREVDTLPMREWLDLVKRNPIRPQAPFDSVEVIRQLRDFYDKGPDK